MPSPSPRFPHPQDGNCVIAGVMEHIEQAGIHSGDSACSIPTQTISPEVGVQIREWTKMIAAELGVVGLINIQFAVQVRQDSTAQHSTALPTRTR
eukprot:126195-Chlamydomonas_euryale.AAC.15